MEEQMNKSKYASIDESLIIPRQLPRGFRHNVFSDTTTTVNGFEQIVENYRNENVSLDPPAYVGSDLNDNQTSIDEEFQLDDANTVPSTDKPINPRQLPFAFWRNVFATTLATGEGANEEYIENTTQNSNVTFPIIMSTNLNGSPTSVSGALLKVNITSTNEESLNSTALISTTTIRLPIDYYSYSVTGPIVFIGVSPQVLLNVNVTLSYGFDPGDSVSQRQMSTILIIVLQNFLFMY